MEIKALESKRIITLSNWINPTFMFTRRKLIKLLRYEGMKHIKNSKSKSSNHPRVIKASWSINLYKRKIFVTIELQSVA